MQTILITGGTGLIGTALSTMLASQGNKVIILTRHPRKQVLANVHFALWDVTKGTVDRHAIAEADHIIHLAGAGVADKRWSVARKQEIRNSRIQSGNLLVRALSETANKVQTFVSASAIGWYGPDQKGMKRPFVETDPAHTDFLGETCRIWEESVRPVESMGKRLVILRTPIVFSRNGGAYPELTKTLRLGIASILGGGKQVISWIHIDDICRMYLFAIEQTNLRGIFNACAPETITNKELVLKAAKVSGRPYIAVHVPEFALKLVLGEMSIEVLKSATVSNQKIRNEGFRYLFPTVDAALNELNR